MSLALSARSTHGSYLYSQLGSALPDGHKHFGELRALANTFRGQDPLLHLHLLAAHYGCGSVSLTRYKGWDLE